MQRIPAPQVGKAPDVSRTLHFEYSILSHIGLSASHDLNHTRLDAFALPEPIHSMLDLPRPSQHTTGVPVAAVQEHNAFGAPQAQSMNHHVIVAARQTSYNSPGFHVAAPQLRLFRDFDGQIFGFCWYEGSVVADVRDFCHAFQRGPGCFAFFEHAQTQVEFERCGAAGSVDVIQRSGLFPGAFLEWW